MWRADIIELGKIADQKLFEQNERKKTHWQKPDAKSDDIPLEDRGGDCPLSPTIPWHPQAHPHLLLLFLSPSSYAFLCTTLSPSLSLSIPNTRSFTAFSALSAPRTRLSGGDATDIALSPSAFLCSNSPYVSPKFSKCAPNTCSNSNTNIRCRQQINLISIQHSPAAKFLIGFSQILSKCWMHSPLSSSCLRFFFVFLFCFSHFHSLPSPNPSLFSSLLPSNKCWWASWSWCWLTGWHRSGIIGCHMGRCWVLRWCCSWQWCRSIRFTKNVHGNSAFFSARVDRLWGLDNLNAIWYNWLPCF